MISDKQIEDRRAEIYKPLETYEVGRNEIVGGTVSPSYILPIQGLQRLEKLMDEYAGGITVNYMTNEPLLLRGLELMKTFHEIWNSSVPKTFTSYSVPGAQASRNSLWRADSSPCPVPQGNTLARLLLSWRLLASR